MKRCRLCGESKPLDQFFNMTRARDGKQQSCKPCQVRDNYRRRLLDKPKMSRHNRRQQLRRFNMTPERYDALLAEQNGVCAICGVERPSVALHGAASGLAVDHAHACCPEPPTCGLCTRGLLCGSCNNGLGRFNDDSTLLRYAADYIDRHSK